MKHFLQRWPKWHPEDVAITNDPWLAAGHLHDVAIAVPVFHKGKIVAFSANIAHQADIGGRGYSADANSIFEEGPGAAADEALRRGPVVPEVLQIIAENVRVPDQVLGDIQAQIGRAARRAPRERASGRGGAARSRSHFARNPRALRKSDARGDQARAGRRIHEPGHHGRIRRAARDQPQS